MGTIDPLCLKKTIIWIHGHRKTDRSCPLISYNYHYEIYCASHATVKDFFLDLASERQAKKLQISKCGNYYFYQGGGHLHLLECQYIRQVIIESLLCTHFF